MPSRTRQAKAAMEILAEMAEEETRQEIEAAERACVDHYRTDHSLRLSLWRRLGWAWLMRWPMRKWREPGLGRTVLDPVRFIKATK